MTTIASRTFPDVFSVVAPDLQAAGSFLADGEVIDRSVIRPEGTASVEFSLDVVNLGTAPTYARLTIHDFIPQPGQEWNGPPQLIEPGDPDQPAPVTLTLTLDISGYEPGESEGLRIDLEEVQMVGTMPVLVWVYDVLQFFLTVPRLPDPVLSVRFQRIYRVDCPFPGGHCYVWDGTVDSISTTETGYYRAARTETSPEFGGPVERRTTLRSIPPGGTDSWNANASTAATRISGEMWVEEYDAGGNFIRELNQRQPYDIIL